jgi:hypothetical protein
MKRSQQLIGMGGAAVGVLAGLWGAVRPTAEQEPEERG